ncbi:MAG: Gfo/Idh/MocA family oxidoreductase [Verrucomicrobia bacterium]|nr:Gfo/Idh/MocA family oxidoreductase [Verrucomicrobiota bacterium]
MKTVSRRDFLRASALTAGVTTFGFPQLLLAQNPGNKINIAVVGAAGKGASDTDHCASENIVALCDADENHCAGQLKKYPKAKFYRDFRKMYEEMGKSIDAVIVSAPDHIHAPAAALAIKMGKHVYCQKPLTHSVYEARTLRELARRHKVVTQMGNQGSSEDGLRRAVEVIQAGVIGNIREIHVWSNRPIWPQGIDRPAGEDPVPANLDWDVWLGPAPYRPYKQGVYHPFNWRGWQDFGTGALGDMACHTANMPFRACKLGYPSVVEAEDHSGMNTETYPKSSRIRFEFPAREGLPPIKFWWYDGNPGDKSVTLLRPNPDLTKEIVEMRGELPGSGCLLVGEKGKIFSPDDYGAQFYILMAGEKEYKNGRDHDAVKAVPQTIPRNPAKGDTDYRQHAEWLMAIKANDPNMPYSRFDIAAYLTEIILLGCIALRVGKGKRLDWDGPNMRAKNVPEAAQFVRRRYRKGWTL